MGFVGGFHVSRFPPTQSVKRIDDAGVLAVGAELLSTNTSTNTALTQQDTMREHLKHSFQSWSAFQEDLRGSGTSCITLTTEREGFEPSTEVASCNSLAGSRFQPLSHLSSSKTIVPRGLPNAQITRRGKRCLKLQSTSQGIESASSAQDLGLMVCSPSRPSKVTTSPLSKLLCSVASRTS